MTCLQKRSGGGRSTSLPTKRGLSPLRGETIKNPSYTARRDLGKEKTAAGCGVMRALRCNIPQNIRVEICPLRKILIDSDCLRNRFEMRDHEVVFLLLVGL